MGRLRPLRLLLVSFLLTGVVCADLRPQIPSVANFTPSAAAAFTITSAVRIVVDAGYAYNGNPSLLDFAQTFHDDLVDIAGFNTSAVQVSSSFKGSHVIFLTLGGQSHALYNTNLTDEGYDLDVTESTITIKAAAPIGVWWGTRTVLQQAVLSAGAGNALSIPSGTGWDAPGWEVRGFMLDAGRHWFETSFLSDLCTYASFFKLNEVHIHASDNLWDPNWLYTDLWPELYSGFRFRPSNGSAVYGVVPKLNESWTQADFRAMQSSCAAHGVTIIPEIDTPGHSLAISQWKPELMLAGNPDQLNLSFPETIPTVKALWDEFLPWFTASEVSIGADEYPSQYADEYISFVNDMSSYIITQSNKSIRAWGTYEPSTTQFISKDITIQHWDFPGDTIPVQLLAAGYHIINSEQAFLYLDGKTSDSGQFPQSLNESLLWSTPWAPNIFTASDPSNNTTPDNPFLRGAIFALWEDWGNNATDPYEVYLQLARSVAIFGEKTWAGSGVRTTELDAAMFDGAYPVLNAKAPGQNLNRAVKPESGNVVFSYDLEGHDFSWGPVTTPYMSVGPPYTLTFTVTPTSDSGVLFSGQDAEILVSNLTFRDVATNQYYVPPYSLPLNEPTTIFIQATQSYTYALVNGKDGFLWTTLMDIWGEYMAVGNMSFPAPSWQIGGPGFEGSIGKVELILGP